MAGRAGGRTQAQAADAGRLAGHAGVHGVGRGRTGPGRRGLRALRPRLRQATRAACRRRVRPGQGLRRPTDARGRAVGCRGRGRAVPPGDRGDSARGGRLRPRRHRHRRGPAGPRRPGGPGRPVGGPVAHPAGRDGPEPAVRPDGRRPGQEAPDTLGPHAHRRRVRLRPERHGGRVGGSRPDRGPAPRHHADAVPVPGRVVGERAARRAGRADPEPARRRAQRVPDVSVAQGPDRRQRPRLRPPI